MEASVVPTGNSLPAFVASPSLLIGNSRSYNRPYNKDVAMFPYLFSDALEARNQGLFRLREIDDELRSIDDQVARIKEFNDLMDERECLCEALMEMNAIPWPFSLDEDLSWLK